MEEIKTHICTDCMYTGEPHISLGRLFIEFFANLLTGVGGVSLFQKVRHCPECGKHSMVPIETEAGKLALSKRNENLEINSKQNSRDPSHAPSNRDDEYMRIRQQR